MATSGEQFEKKETPALGAAPAQEKVSPNPVSPAMQRMRDMEEVGRAMKMQKLVERICKAHDRVLWPKLDWSKVAGSTINELNTLFEQGFDLFAGVNPRPNNPIVFLKNKKGQRREFAIVLNPEQKANRQGKVQSADRKNQTEPSEVQSAPRSFEELKLDWAGRWDQMGHQDKVALLRSIREKAQYKIGKGENIEFEADSIANEFMDAVGIPENQRAEFVWTIQNSERNIPETRAERGMRYIRYKEFNEEIKKNLEPEIAVEGDDTEITDE